MLAERLGIGRTPIREALQRLARERLVTILPRRGVVVSAIDVAAQLRLLEVNKKYVKILDLDGLTNTFEMREMRMQ